MCIRDRNAELAHQHNDDSNKHADNKLKNKTRMLIYKISAPSSPSSNNSCGECPICFEDMEVGDKVARLECLCVFHYKCIKSWIQKKKEKMKEYHIENDNTEAEQDRIRGNCCPFHDAVF